MKRHKISILLFLLISLNLIPCFSQEIININREGLPEAEFSLQELVEDILITGNCAQVDNFSEQVFGSPVDVQTKSYGYFLKTENSTFPFENGIVLTTGQAYQAGNTLSSTITNFINGTSGDSDLETALTQTDTYDATFIKFDFVPTTDKISFRYVMASEEYDGATECFYADSFAFLLKKSGTTSYINLAVLPDNTPVSVTNINNSTSCRANIDFFEGYNIGDTNYGGRTVILTASAAVIPFQTYEIKLVIADQGDSEWDSAVFIEGESFNLGMDLGGDKLFSEDSAICEDEYLIDSRRDALDGDFQWQLLNTVTDIFEDIPGEKTPSYLATVSGTYKLLLDLGDGNCNPEGAVIIEFVGDGVPTPIPFIEDIIVCENDFDGVATVDLTQNDAIILDGQSPSDINVRYFLTENDAINGRDEIIGDFTNTANPQEIWIRKETRISINCYELTSFQLIVSAPAQPQSPENLTPIRQCDNTSFGTDIDGFIVFDLTQREITILNGESPSDFTLTYFEDAAYTDLITTPDAFTNTTAGGQTIFVRMTNNLTATCFADTSYEVEVFELPVLNAAPFVLEQCDDDFDGFNIFNLTEINTDIVTNITSEVFTYYETQADALSGNSSITNSITYSNQIVNVDNSLWARVENENECFRITQVELIVKPSAIPIDFLREFFECDAGDDITDGIAAFDFSSVTTEIEAIFPVAVNVFYYENEADATSEINEIPDPSNFTNTNSPNTQEIWVRADSALGNDCLGNGHHITLTVHSLPQFEVEPTAIVCLYSLPIVLSPFNFDNDYIYQWTYPDGTIVDAPSITASEGGEYRVVASYENASGIICQSLPRTITVSESIIASISLLDVTITDDSDNNTVTVNTSNLGIGDYEFTLDNIDGIYQDEPFFDMVAPGLHTIFIRDKNDCGVVDLEVAVIGFPKFFTPNNDGENDFWRVKGVTANYFSTSLITIYDRFGKMIAKVDPTGDGWDGFYNGQQLPASDYWFTAQLIDQEGNVRDRNGHFSLIRR